MNRPQELALASVWLRFLALLLDIVLFPLTLAIGYIIWWLIALGKGQTPGKQLVGIRVIKASGEPSGWLHTFIREFFVKGILVPIGAVITGSIFLWGNYLYAIFDRNNQAIHDKIAGTVVVRNPRGGQGPSGAGAQRGPQRTP